MMTNPGGPFPVLPILGLSAAIMACTSIIVTTFAAARRGRTDVDRGAASGPTPVSRPGRGTT